MNLYEFEGKHLFEEKGIKTPKGVSVVAGMNYAHVYTELGIQDVVVKAQILSGKRGKNNGIYFCSSADEVQKACETLFASTIRNQYVAGVLIEEKLDIREEHYLSISYDTSTRQPVLVYSTKGGMDIEDVGENDIQKFPLDIRSKEIPAEALQIPYAKELWDLFITEDMRVVEINPLVKTGNGEWIAADAKIALDDDAFFRHESWKEFEPRTMMGRPPTDLEIEAKKIDEGEAYYRGTAGKYIEMDGDIAIVFSGAGASIANMDAIYKAGLKPANYTEYSGNPPREKVYELTKLVLSKPGIRGLWMAGAVANFTNVADTFQGVVDAFDEIKPTYPIVVRRGGPFEKEGMQLMRECADRNNLNIKLFGKETSMSDSAAELAKMLQN